MLLIWTINLTAQHVPINLGIICSIWVFQFRWLSIYKRRNFVFAIMFLVFITVCNAECDEFFVMNFIILVLSRFTTKLLAANHLVIWERTKYVTAQKSSKFLLEIMALVLSANNTVPDTDLILRGRLFMYIYIYIKNNTGPRIHPWIPPCFIVPQSEKKKHGPLYPYRLK